MGATTLQIGCLERHQRDHKRPNCGQQGLAKGAEQADPQD